MGKIKQNELDCRDTAPLKNSALTAVKGMQNSNKGTYVKGVPFFNRRYTKGVPFS